jgi:hypothetical protein
VLFVLGLFGTALTNGSPLTFPTRRLPGLTLYDVGSLFINIMSGLLPFFVARKLLASPESHVVLLKVLVVVVLGYSLLVLWEVRMSPQLNRQIYGFGTRQWVQHLRSDGFRPMVFLNHGLKVGVVLATGVLAAAALARIGQGRKPLIWGLLISAYLMAVLVLSKNVGATILATLALPVMLLLGARLRVLIAAGLSAIVLLYPMARSTGLMPTEGIVGVLSNVVAQERINSLGFRLRMEDILLEKANDRPIFGWGNWGRSRVFDDLGRDISSTDGTWVITFGERGWVGYLAFFGLLTLPVILLALRKREGVVEPATACLALILAVNMVDLIPNSGISPITWLMAGALVGRLEWQGAPSAAAQAAPRGPVRAPPSHRARPAPAGGPPDPGGGVPASARQRLPYARDLRGGERRPRARDGVPFRRALAPDGQAPDELRGRPGRTDG